MRPRQGAAAVLAAVLISGCGAAERPAAGDRDPAPEPAPATAPPSTAVASPPQEARQGTFVRDGLSGRPAEEYRLEVLAVERLPELTVLRMEITSLADRPHVPIFGFGLTPVDFGGFRLLDPVGRRLYHPLREGDHTGRAFGSRHVASGAGTAPAAFRPGVRYPVEVYFPPLPATVDRVTVLPMGGFRELTGVPVTPGTAPPAAAPGDTGRPRPGETFRWPVVPPSGRVWSHSAEVHQLVETAERSVLHAGDQETVALRTDVLFGFDEAELSPAATEVLDRVVAELRSRADPGGPPIRIEGHTDDRGPDDYNLDLSLRRARAVRDHLAARLGPGHAYRVAGKGEREPAARNTTPDGKDDPEGRARNRRVEVTYRLRPHSDAAAGPYTGAARGPAPFAADPGPVVGTIDVRWRFGDLRVAVRPFRRDGAYLVAALDVVNQGDRDFNDALPRPLAGRAPEFAIGSMFNACTVVDPATGARYYPVRAGDVFLESRLRWLRPGQSDRVFIYYPAPPDDTVRVTFAVEDFGAVEDVPIA